MYDGHQTYPSFVTKIKNDKSNIPSHPVLWKKIKCFFIIMENKDMPWGN